MKMYYQVEVKEGDKWVAFCEEEGLFDTFEEAQAMIDEEIGWDLNAFGESWHEYRIWTISHD